MYDLFGKSCIWWRSDGFNFRHFWTNFAHLEVSFVRFSSDLHWIFRRIVALDAHKRFIANQCVYSFQKHPLKETVAF